ncbi:MAG: leucine-rich repeat domain-containing protein [Bacteroidetes bacterium]|nr:leucine-rich repeat domain-containing protein [Bacteroidota bacterium]
MSVRLIKVSREFNIGVSTIVEFLGKKGYKIDSDPNTKLSDELVDLLEKEFQGESVGKSTKTPIKPVKAQVIVEDEEDDDYDDEEEITPAPQKSHINVKVIGTIDIDAHKRSKAAKSKAGILIQENIRNKSKILDIGNCGLTNLSNLPELFNCVHIEELILSNEWAEYENEKWQLRKSKNTGERNVLSSLPSEISNLTNLRKLICGGDWKDGNSWNRWKIKSISTLSKLKKLEYLNISNNRVESLEGIEKLLNINTIHLNNNFISNIRELKNLKKLESVFLSNNLISNVSALKYLPAIQTIDLHANEIEDISPLKGLISKLDIENTKWKLNTINIAKNPLGKPPIEIITMGKNAVLQYFKDIETSKTCINKDVKVILVGNSEVGKTKLAKFLENEKDLDIPHPFTLWLDEREIESKYDIESINGKCIIRLFDFGGHDFFHDTHHLFYGTNTIYILLWETNTNKLDLRTTTQKNKKREEINVQIQDYPIKYWLESVKHYIKEVKAENVEFDIQETYNSSLLIIQNKADEPSQIVHLNNQSIIEKYPFVFDFINISINKRRNLVHFDSLFKEMITKSKIIGRVLPQFYDDIKESIKDYTGKPILELNEFHDYCNTISTYEIDFNQFHLLTSYLKIIGVILWYPERNTNNKVYINKEWVISNIHNILEGLIDKKGEFNLEYATSKIEGNEERKAKDTIAIMTDFKMIFEHPFHQDTYIAPLYLPPIPVSTISLFLDKKNIPYRRFEYSGFIHKHVVLSFFSKYGKLIAGSNDTYYYWKDGLIVKDPNTEAIAMIQFNIGDTEGNAFIDIFDITKTDKTFIDNIISYIKEINKGYEIEEMVTLDGEDYLSLEMLLSNAKDGKLFFSEQRNSDKNKSKPAKQKYFKLKDYDIYLKDIEIKKKKVVISYSKKDLTHVHTLKRYLKPLVDMDLIEEPWYCTNLRPSEDWEKTIKQKFENADIVFFMVSDYFYSTKYIVEQEITTTIDRYDRNNESVKIIPIILEPYDWKRKEPYNLQRFTALPFEAKPISDYKNPKLAWFSIAESVKMMIEKDLDPGKVDEISRYLQEIYERQVKGKLDDNS